MQRPPTRIRRSSSTPEPALVPPRSGGSANKALTGSTPDVASPWKLLPIAPAKLPRSDSTGWQVPRPVTASVSCPRGSSSLPRGYSPPRPRTPSRIEAKFRIRLSPEAEKPGTAPLADKLPRPGTAVRVATQKDALLQNSGFKRRILGGAAFHSKYDPKGVLFFRDVFRDMDIDNDGLVDASEFQDAMSRRAVVIRETFSYDSPAVRNLQWDTIFRTLDEDRSGTISFPEVLKLVYPFATERELVEMFNLAFPQTKGKVRVPARELTDEQIAEISDLFDLYDADGDGSLTLDEFRNATMSMENITRDDCRRMLDAMDLNQDSVLSFEEFLQGMRKLYLER
eukprot:TRINITY_DN19386_c0_g1_i1.p1 TRINITY_DN19386_c0_g1~~TRINITY_DN19386_c0_g1_i1.p1  ORF type:complete len:340 (-),score=74.24 TRINITY_DN19386_c0_g1_i1:204-1223(-)